MYGYITNNGELYHHGVKGQKWGIRRYQNADGTLTAEGRKRYGFSRKPGTFAEWGNDISNSRENRIFRRANRDKYRQYIEDAKKGEFFKNYKKNNKAFDSVVEQAIKNYRKQYTPEELYNTKWKQKYARNLGPIQAVYGSLYGGSLARRHADTRTTAEWNRSRFNPYRETHKLVPTDYDIYSKRNEPVFDNTKSTFENRVAAKRYIDDQKKQKKAAKEAAKEAAKKNRAKYYD